VESVEEDNKASSNFTAPIALGYRLSTDNFTLSELNNELPGLDLLLKQNQRVKKLWPETRDPACNTAVKCSPRNSVEGSGGRHLNNSYLLTYLLTYVRT
jgi:hypothetical protein